MTNPYHTDFRAMALGLASAHVCQAKDVMMMPLREALEWEARVARQLQDQIDAIRNARR